LEPSRIYAPSAAEMENERRSWPAWTYEATTVKGPWVWIEADLTANPPAAGDQVVSVWPAVKTLGQPLLTDVDIQVSYNFAGKAG